MPEQKTNTKDLIDPTLLFRFEIEIQQASLEWTKKGLVLSEKHRLPSFGALGGRPVFADVRTCWSDNGIGFHLIVAGKRQLPWCRDTRLDESDGIQFWIDTRCSPGIHRATQYCHHFLFMPAGGGSKREKPVASLVEIHRAKGNPKPISADELSVNSVPKHDGYVLSGVIPRSALTGFDTASQQRIGFYYMVVDRELGWQTLGPGPDYPVAEDPSLWSEAVLKRQ